MKRPLVCTGEKCSTCGSIETYHKVGEENPWNSFGEDLVEEELYAEFEMKHNFTAYLCHPCFVKVMGPLSDDRRFCQQMQDIKL